MTLVLYGIVRAAHPAPRPAPRGIGTPPGPVRLVRSDPLAAAVSETEEVSELGETEARTALDIMTRLLADGPVLPMCLGSIAPDEAAVREEVLEPLGDELAGRLDALDGLVEVYVDVDEDQRSAVAGALRADGRSASPASPHDLDAQIELGHAVAELVLGRRSEQAEAFLSALRPLARADAPRGPHGGVEDPPCAGPSSSRSTPWPRSTRRSSDYGPPTHTWPSSTSARCRRWISPTGRSISPTRQNPKRGTPLVPIPSPVAGGGDGPASRAPARGRCLILKRSEGPERSHRREQRKGGQRAGRGLRAGPHQEGEGSDPGRAVAERPPVRPQ